MLFVNRARESRDCAERGERPRERVRERATLNRFLSGDKIREKA